MIQNSIVGLDLDYTLARFKIPFWEIALELCGYTDIYSPKRFGIMDYPNDVQKVITNLFNCKWYMVNLLDAYLDSFLFMLWLKAHNNTIHIISCRTHDLRKHTTGWIKGQYGSRVSSVWYVNTHEEKIFYFEKLGLNYWIDDNAKICFSAARMGIYSYMIKQTWNEEAEIYLQNVKRVNTLSGIIHLEESNG